MKIEENYAFYLFTFFQIIFLCHTIIFFTPVSFSGRHVRTVRIEVLTPLMHTNLRVLSTPVIYPCYQSTICFNPLWKNLTGFWLLFSLFFTEFIVQAKISISTF